MQSVFSAVRMRGAGVGAAYAVQAALSLAASLAWPRRSDAAFELKAVGPATASVPATPYALDYDLVVLAMAIASFARHGRRERLPRPRDQPAGHGVDRTPAVARHRRPQRRISWLAGAADAPCFYVAARGSHTSIGARRLAQA